MPVLQRAYIHLNLSRNPFGECTREQRCENAVCSLDLSELRDALRRPHSAVQFLGKHGRGKSTHLIALHAQCTDSHSQKHPPTEIPYTQYHPGDCAQLPLNAALCFFDSFDVIHKKQRRQIYQQLHSLACTTHRDLSREFTRAGFQVHTIHISQTQTSQLHNIFNRRIIAVRRKSTDPIPQITHAHIQELQQLFDDDIRAMENHLYTIFAQLKDIDHVSISA